MFQKIKNQIKKSQTDSKRKQIEKLEKEQQARKDAANFPSPESSSNNGYYPEYPHTIYGRLTPAVIIQLIDYPLRTVSILIIGCITIGSLSFLINHSIDFYTGIMFIFFIAMLFFGMFVVWMYFVRIFEFFSGLRSGQSRFSILGGLSFVLYSFLVGLFALGALVSPFGIYFLGADLITPTQKLCATYLGPTGKEIDVAGNGGVYYKTEQRFLINNEQKDMIELKLDYSKIPINTKICFDYKPNSKIMNNDRIE